MTWLNVIRKNIEDPMIGPQGPQGPQGETGPQGPIGLPGAPGAAGPSVELRVYFGTIQWRVVGEEVWNHLINLSEITGADGRDVEMRTVVNEAETCQTLQWRLLGETEWNDLAETPICENEAPAPPSNSAQVRCGVAVAVTAAVAAAYRRAKLDPDNWDALQDYSAQAAAAGTTVSIAAGALGKVFEGAAIIGGVGLIGGIIAGAATFLASILALTNDNTDQITVAIEEDLAAALYCVLSRRETTAITAAVLREWISYIADAGLPAADLDIVLGILAWMPIIYWQNEASVAPPKINPCALTTCANRDTQFSYEFFAEPVPGTIQILKPLAAALMQILTGERDIRGIAAVAGPLNTRSFNITVHLGRIVPITGIELEAWYNQTANVTSPVLTLQGENILKSASITGIDDGFVSLRWSGAESIDRFTISGIVGTTGDFDETALLELYRIKICGFGWPTFGQSNDTNEPCEYDPCIDGIDYGYDQCKTFDFAQSSTCWGGAAWVSGEGLTPTLGVQDFSLKWYEGSVNLGWPGGGQVTIRRVEVEATYEAASGSNAGAPYLRMWGNTTGQVFPINVSPPTAGRQTYVWTGSLSVPQLGLSYRLWKNTSYPNSQPDSMGGLMRIHRLTVWYNGSERTWTC